MDDAVIAAGPNGAQPVEAWPPEYAAYILEHVAPGHDWPSILIDEWVSLMIAGDETLTRPMCCSRDALFHRSDLERLVCARTGGEMMPEEVSRRIDEFQAEDQSSDDDDGDDAAHGFAVKLDGDAADDLLCMLDHLHERQEQTQGGALAIAYALRLMSNRSSGAQADRLRRLAKFAGQLSQDTANARAEVEKITRIVEGNQRLQRERQRQNASRARKAATRPESADAA